MPKVKFGIFLAKLTNCVPPDLPGEDAIDPIQSSIHHFSYEIWSAFKRTQLNKHRVKELQ